jgi:hypothetical protein
LRGFGGFLSGGTGQDFRKTPLAQALDEEHDNRLHVAQMHQRNLATATAALHMIGQGVNPETHERFNNDDPQSQVEMEQLRKKYTAWQQDAESSFSKAVGKSKGAKSIIDRGKMILQHVLGIGGAAQPADQGGAATAAPKPQGGPTPPPTATPDQPDTRSIGQIATQETPTPPPDYDMAARAQLSDTGRSIEEERTFQTKAREESFKAGLEREKAEAIERMRESAPAKTAEAAWLQGFRETHGRNPTDEEAQAHYKAEREKMIDEVIDQGITASKAGDKDKAKQLFDIAQQAAAAKKGGASTSKTLLGYMDRALHGDKDAADVVKASLDYQRELGVSRALAFGRGRAMYQFGTWLDADSGESLPLTNYDAVQMIKSGRQLMHIGNPSFKDTASIQRFQKETLQPRVDPATGKVEPSAIEGVRQNLKAYDNLEDRLIFARVLSKSGVAEYGKDSLWVSNVLDQMGKENLSPEGRALLPRLARLNETVGTVRQALGAPATDNSMTLMKALLPGPSTTDSAMAEDYLNQFEQNVRNAIEIPAMRRMVPGGNKPTAPPASSTSIDDEIMNAIKAGKKP